MSIFSEPGSISKIRPDDSFISGLVGFTPHKLKNTQSMALLTSSQDSSVLHDHSVQVIIRARPLSTSEISSQGDSKCIKHESNSVITWTGQPETRFTFDFVADETVSQEELFNLAGVSMVENCMGGYNSCMFAYGQTGSGKTHTMLGDIEGGTRRHSVNCGMTPRIFEYLFSRIQKEKEIRKDDHLSFTCKCSFLEIYNEQILDLLDPSSSNLQIREDLKKGVYVENLKEVEIKNAREVLLQLIQGAANRKVAATNMNHASSRSHSVFTCIIESKWESQGVSHHRFARLNLVDLAGSERQKSSGAEGERLKEATNINKSLSTLGLVIMNLVSISNGKSLHVPYRDSKLTFLLQDSLGGNSKTTIIANISPSLCCSLETLSTLKFAQRAKFIKNNAIINEDASGDVIAMRSQIQQLKKEVDRLRGLAYGDNKNKLDDLSMIEASISVGGFLGESASNDYSPFASEIKRLKKSDYEIALVGAYRAIKDKDASIQSLAAENQAVVHLAKQRADEIQSLKLRLRFREAAIKRMEGAVIGKVSAEKHFLAERDEHIKEIEVLRNQVDRNQEVTRFAMENLQLKEEIRKFKSLHDEGETDLMKQQVAALQNKLLEALDWKLMHEASSSLQESLQETAKEPDDCSLISDQKSQSPSPAGESSALRIQLEKEVLQKQLEFCYTEKEQLERHVNDLIREIEIERARNEQLHSHSTNLAREIESEKSQKQHFQRQVDDLTKELNDGKGTVPTASNVPDMNELKTMVDVISTASQREAEAHNKAILLLKENEALRETLSSFTAENSDLLGQLNAATDEKDRLLQMQERSHDSLSKLTALYDRTLSERDQLQTCQHRFKTSFSQFYEACTEHWRLEESVETKRTEVGLYRKLSSEADERAVVSDNKLAAYKSVVSLVGQLEEEECRARANVESARGEMEVRVVEMERLLRKKSEAEIMMILNERLKSDLEKHYYVLQSKTEAQKEKNERMLVAIENNVKASDLLSSQEENSKLLSEKKAAKQTLMSVKKTVDQVRSYYRKVKREMELSEGSFTKLSEKVDRGMAAVGEIREKRDAVSFCGDDVEDLVVAYQESLFHAELKRLETRVLEEELGEMVKKVDGVRSLRSSVTESMRCLVSSVVA